MSIQSEINRIKTDKESLITALEEKGIEIADGATLGDISIDVGNSEIGGGNNIKTFELTIVNNTSYRPRLFYSTISETNSEIIAKIGVCRVTPTTTFSNVICNTHSFISITDPSFETTPAYTVTENSGKVLCWEVLRKNDPFQTFIILEFNETEQNENVTLTINPQ